MERTAIRSLELEGDERVLEIGFGGGMGIRRLIKTLEWGTVSGVDPSDRMVQRARERVQRLRSSFADLRIGIASDLPWPDDHFDAVVSVNNVMQWPKLHEGLTEVRRVLKPEGKVSIAWTGKRPS